MRRVDFEGVVVDVFQPPAEFTRINPLGQVPVWVPGDGGGDGNAAIPDSTLILRELGLDEGLATDRRVRSVLAVGVMEQTVRHFLESRQASPDRDTLAECIDTIAATLTRLEGGGDDGGGVWDLADWDLAIACQYLDLRLPEKVAGWKWRERFPGLARHLSLAMDHPSHGPVFHETAPPA